MTKQDYEALAALVKAARSGYDDQEGNVDYALDNLARDMAQYTSRYPAFDEARFLAAAGVS